MSKNDKELQKIKQNPKNVSFNTLKKILENRGYKAYNTGGSHFVFRKENEHIITIPFKNPVKAIYVKLVLKALKED